ncbi:MAG TPA: hypothetical protein VFJ51_04985 [Nitrososphaeraceae archaeon]|nr:hypothetical protein [Nitrososphaeraceae archaeon]
MEWVCLTKQERHKLKIGNRRYIGVFYLKRMGLFEVRYLTGVRSNFSIVDLTSRDPRK